MFEVKKLILDTLAQHNGMLMERVLFRCFTQQSRQWSLFHRAISELQGEGQIELIQPAHVRLIR